MYCMSVSYTVCYTCLCTSLYRLVYSNSISIYTHLCTSYIGTACLYFEAADLPYELMMTPYFSGILLVNGLVAFTLNVAVVLLIGKVEHVYYHLLTYV